MKGIKEALKAMLADGEFERIIKSARGGERARAKEYYHAIKDFNEDDFEKVPAIVFIKACKSWSVWQDVYCYLEMVNKDEKQDAEKA